MNLQKLYHSTAILIVCIAHVLSLPQDINFSAKPNENKEIKNEEDIKTRFGLVASVLGKV